MKLCQLQIPCALRLEIRRTFVGLLVNLHYLRQTPRLVVAVIVQVALSLSVTHASAETIVSGQEKEVAHLFKIRI